MRTNFLPIMQYSWVAAGVASAGLTLAAVKLVSGNNKEKKAKRAREALKAPFYQIQDEYYQNANTAASLAQGGLPSATKDYYTNQSERGLSAGIKGILGSGGNPNDISKIFQTYEDSIGKISAVDAETHLNNIKYYMGVNKDLAGQKTIQWAINKQQPYLNTLKELSAAQKAGEAQKNEAYSDAMSSISSFGTSMAGGSGGFGGGSGGGSASNYSRLFSSGSGGRTARPEREHDDNIALDSTTNRNNWDNPHSNIADPFGDTQGNDAGYEDYQNYLRWKRQYGKI